MGGTVSLPCCGGKEPPGRPVLGPIIRVGSAVHRVCLHKSIPGKETEFKDYMTQASQRLAKFPVEGMMPCGFALPADGSRCWTVMIFEEFSNLETYRTDWCTEHMRDMDMAQPHAFNHCCEVAKSLNNGKVLPGNVVRVITFKAPPSQVLSQDMFNIVWRKATDATHGGVVSMLLSKSDTHAVFSIIYESREAMEAGKIFIRESCRRLKECLFEVELDDGGDSDAPLTVVGA